MALFVAALLIWFVVRVVEVVLLVFVAVLMAVYLSADTDVLERRWGVRRWLGLTATVILTTLALFGMSALPIPPVLDQTQALMSGLPNTLADAQNALSALESVFFPTQGLKFAVVVIATLPILCFYPFLQKHFVKGVLIGSVKE